MKLRGLQKYLQQNLGMTVDVVESFRGLKGSSVVNSPQFEENVSSFGVSYGLCIQALNRGVLSTNLLPGEILRERLIRAKKPWAMMTAATLLLGCGLGYVFNSLAWKTTKTDPFAQPFAATSALVSKSSGLVSTFTDAEKKFDTYDLMGKQLAAIPERQLLWPLLMRAINEALPQANKTTAQIIANEKGPIPLGLRDQIHITSIDCEYVPRSINGSSPLPRIGSTIIRKNQRRPRQRQPPAKNPRRPPKGGKALLRRPPLDPPAAVG